MSTEARKVMTLSMVKITSSRTRKNGINLRQNLLVANVMLSARSVFMSGSPKKRELKRQRRMPTLKPASTTSPNTRTGLADCDRPAYHKLARMQSVSYVTSSDDDDAVVPDMDGNSEAEQDSPVSPEPAAPEKSRKRLHRDSMGDEDEERDRSEQPDSKHDRCHDVTSSLNNLVSRFNGLLERNGADVDCDVVGNDEPTTDGFIKTCSTKVIEYDMSSRTIQLEV